MEQRLLMIVMLELKEHNTIEELRREIKKAREGRYLLRVQCILLRKEGLRPGEIEERLLISRNTYSKWIHRYNEKGLEGLKTRKPSGRKRKWDKKLFKELFDELDKNNKWWNVKRMQEFIKNKHNVEIPEDTVRKIVKKAGYSWKTSRPSPYKGDKKRQEAFKKTF